MLDATGFDGVVFAEREDCLGAGTEGLDDATLGVFTGVDCAAGFLAMMDDDQCQ